MLFCSPLFVKVLVQRRRPRLPKAWGVHRLRLRLPGGTRRRLALRRIQCHERVQGLHLSTCAWFFVRILVDVVCQSNQPRYLIIASDIVPRVQKSRNDENRLVSAWRSAPRGLSGSGQDQQRPHRSCRLCNSSVWNPLKSYMRTRAASVHVMPAVRGSSGVCCRGAGYID